MAPWWNTVIQEIERAHEMHVVIDDDQRRRLVDPLDDGDEPVGLGIGEAGRGLVEQNEPRLVGENGADLHQLALPVRELAHQPAGDAVEFKLGDDLLDRGVGAVVPGGAPGRQPEVFEHGEPVHHRGHLRLHADAEPHDVTRRPAGHVLAADEDPAAGIGGADLAGDRLEERALARPVGADQAAQFAFAQQ